MIKLDRILYTSTHYSANYGFIPKTYADDKDPLDVLVLCQEKLDPMVLVRCYPIGVIRMEDSNEVDDKIIAVPFGDPEEAITKFRELCLPDVDFSGSENKCRFYLISYYLYKVGYEIKEFPRLLDRPPITPSDFTYGEIRNRIIAVRDDDTGTVRYAVRRTFVARLTFEQKSTYVDIDDPIKSLLKYQTDKQRSII